MSEIPSADLRESYQRYLESRKEQIHDHIERAYFSIEVAEDPSKLFMEFLRDEILKK